MTDLSLEDVEKVLELLHDFPSDGQLQRQEKHREVSILALTLGFVERREVTKSCKTCGHEQFDYAFFRITAAGRALLLFADAV